MIRKSAVLIFSLMLLTACGNKSKEEKKEIKNNSVVTESAVILNKENDSTTEEVITVLENAKNLNTEGYRLYKNKKYKEALNKFQKSIEADENYAMAHYNYACTIGVLLKLDYENWYEKKGEVIEHLNKVVKLDKKYCCGIIKL